MAPQTMARLGLLLHTTNSARSKGPSLKFARGNCWSIRKSSVNGSRASDDTEDLFN